MISFTGRVVLVTGAGHGIGASHARELAARGASVVVNDLGSAVDGRPDGTDPAAGLAAELTRDGHAAVASHHDVAAPEGGRAMVDLALDRFGRLDAVIHNAGNRRNRPVGRTTPEDLDALLAVHLKGALHVAQPAFAVMRDQGYGRLLVTGSGAGMFGNDGQCAYAAAKAGAFGLARALAVEGAPHGVTANVLLPTAATERSMAGLSRQARTSLGSARSGFAAAATPRSVTALALYLVSEQCTLTNRVFGAAAGRYYEAFVGTTPGWRAPAPATPDDVAAHLDEILDRDGYLVPARLGDDLAASMRPPAPSGRDLVGAYFAAVHARDAAALRDLFAPDARVELPGRVLDGADAITGYYRDLFARVAPAPRPGPVATADGTAAVQVELRLGDATASMVDLFTHARGRITRLRVYRHAA
ncbi:SDR family NAD(P)-dependent oxidoreductase [Actinomadura gamaensis]|uniref:SDR family NAD(P)-dependent oxidoreductase n=1 Tax=Actinomadura gamaensis TaxID=1763541 RepID=A0ABV9U7I8_9ACTN